MTISWLTISFKKGLFNYFFLKVLLIMQLSNYYCTHAVAPRALLFTTFPYLIMHELPMTITWSSKFAYRDDLC